MTNNKKDNKNLTDNELYYSKVCEKNRKIIQNATRDGITVCGFARGMPLLPSPHSPIQQCCA